MALDSLPDYGHLYPLEEFINHCKDGCFIDWDGIGYYATNDQIDRELEAKPSEILKGKVNKNFTHVMWFNK